MAKQNIARRFHISPSNEDGSRSALADETRLEFHFFDGEPDDDGKPTTSTVLTLGVDDIPALRDVPEGLPRQAVFHGLSQKWGDVFAKADGVADAIEKADEMRDRLIAGEFLTEREGGSERGNTILREAILRVLSKAGKNVDPETEDGAARVAKVDETLADKEESKKWKAHAGVKAEMEDIKAERQKERQRKARAAAKTAGDAGLEAFD